MNSPKFQVHYTPCKQEVVRNRHAHGEDGVVVERLSHEMFYFILVFQTTQTHIRNAWVSLYCTVEMYGSFSA